MRQEAITSKIWSTNSNRSSDHIIRSLLLSVIFLTGVGLVMVYSASFIFASQTYGDGFYFFRKQSLFALASLAALTAASFMPFKWFRKYFWVGFGLAVCSLAAVFIPGLGHRAGGAARWIKIGGGINFEPAEFVKIVSVFCFAYLMAEAFEGHEKKWKFWLKLFSLIGLLVGILLKQPDFGSVVIIMLVGISMLFCFGISLRALMVVLAMALPAGIGLIVTSPYRLQRLLVFLNPWNDPSHGGFQVIQSLVAFHSGGLLGVGLGKGQAKLFFLPEAHTDFILSVVGEEGGLIGLVGIFVVFGILVFKGFQISARCRDGFGKMVALGISCLLAVQGLINGGVVTGLLPTKGLTMPFLSYGGSSLVAMGLACGILINIHRQQTINDRSI